MSQIKNNIQSDISNNKTSRPARIDEVGLEPIEVPVRIIWKGEPKDIQASFSILVSVDRPEMRGIHMSRLYLTLHEFIGKNHITASNLVDLLESCIQSQKGISNSGRIKMSFKIPVKRRALKSNYEGWHTYSCFFEAQKKLVNGQSKVEFSMGADVLYSSTCPCSAALSRELIQDHFKKEVQDVTQEKVLDWLGKESSHVGLPHSQKSEARFRVVIKPQASIDLLDIINSVEKALATPVQVVVKREDEQEFAHLNSQHLMYTEDAIRKIKHQLDSLSMVSDYNIQVRHLESLHPFNTLARLRKVKK